MTAMMADPRVREYREALADLNKGLRAPDGAHDRYRSSLGPYLDCMAEHTPAEPPFVRRQMMRALYESGLPLTSILVAYRATTDEAEYVQEHPPIVAEPVDEQERLARMPYGLYLKTGHWKVVRADALRRAGGKCIICNRSDMLQVHHRDYSSRGAERPSDVVVMCDQDHALFHKTRSVA